MGRVVQKQPKVEFTITNRDDMAAGWEKIKPLCERLRLSETPSRRMEGQNKERCLKIGYDEIVLNALKHGGGRASVSAVVNEELGNIRITVADEGPGIPKTIDHHLAEHARKRKGGEGGLLVLRSLLPLTLIETPDDHLFLPTTVSMPNLLSPPEKGTKVSIWMVGSEK